MSDIVDRITELVDQTMAGGEPETGYNYGDPTYPKCPHCQRHWHGLPITERIAQMYMFGIFDENYLVTEDDSPVLCQGSEFIGPMPAEPYPSAGGGGGYSYQEHFAPPLTDVTGMVAEYLSAALGVTVGFDTSNLLRELDGTRVGVEIDGQVFVDEAHSHTDEETGITTVTIGEQTNPVERERPR